MSLWTCFGISQHRRISLNNSYLCFEYRLISYVSSNFVYIVLRQPAVSVTPIILYQLARRQRLLKASLFVPMSSLKLSSSSL